MLYFQFLVVAAVFGGIAWVAAGRGGGLTDPAPDRPDVALPADRQLGKPDIDAARFSVGWRGYRMDEVDHVLDRLAAEIEYRDRLIAELGGAGAGVVEAGGSPRYEAVGTSYEAATARVVVVEDVEAAGGAGDGEADEAAAEGQAQTGLSDSDWYRRPEPPQ